MTARSVSIVLTGSGGSGVMTAGEMLLGAAARAGLYGYMTRSSDPQIRGGEAAAMIRLSTDPASSHTDRYDLLLAIDWQNVGRFAAEMPLDGNSLVIGDPKMGDAPEEVVAMDARNTELPMQEICKANKGWRPNMLALGAVSALIGLPEEHIFGLIEKKLGRKGEEAFALSVDAVKAGIEAAGKMPEVPKLGKGSDDISNRWSITGNEAAGLGGVRGGVRFVAAYPITPATESLEWLAPALKKVGGVLVQAEDELASVTQIIGGSFGGNLP